MKLKALAVVFTPDQNQWNVHSEEWAYFKERKKRDHGNIRTLVHTPQHQRTLLMLTRIENIDLVSRPIASG